jgi:hypothetical protein
VYRALLGPQRCGFIRRKTLEKRSILFLVIICLGVIAGCDSQFKVTNGDSLNPATTATMRNAKLHGHAKSAQN